MSTTAMASGVRKTVRATSRVPSTATLSERAIFVFILADFVQINLVLMVFNFIPIPPLDGSKVLYALLDQGTVWRLRPTKNSTAQGTRARLRKVANRILPGSIGRMARPSSRFASSRSAALTLSFVATYNPPADAPKS